MEQKMRVMPHNTDAEKCILGSILIDNELGKDIIPELQAEDFYLSAHKDIFDKIKELYHSNKEVDLVTLADKLNQGGLLENVGGVEYLAEVSEILPSAANYKFYVEIVKRDSIRRRLIRESQQIIQDSFENEDAKELVSMAEKNIFDLSISDSRSKPARISDTLGEVLDSFDEYAKNKGKLKGITTGFRDLDRMLNGLNRSDLILVAARPAAGKTSFAMNLVENAALAGYTCAVFSLEMPKVQIGQRILCSNSEVSMSKALRGELVKEEWDKLMQSQAIINECKIFVDDTASITPADIQSKARSLKSQHGLDLIMIDYIQLMSSGSSKKDQNRQLEIAEISRSLKLIARELDVPVVALSQLSRQIETRNPPLPQLSDLRDSGAIEQDADVIMFIHNPSAVPKNGKDQAEAESDAILGGSNGNNRQIMVRKHRNGETGDVNLGWIGECTKFTNVMEVGSAIYQPPRKEVNEKEEEARLIALQKEQRRKAERESGKHKEDGRIAFRYQEVEEYSVPEEISVAIPVEYIAPPQEVSDVDFGFDATDAMEAVIVHKEPNEAVSKVMESDEAGDADSKVVDVDGGNAEINQNDVQKEDAIKIEAKELQERAESQEATESQEAEEEKVAEMEEVKLSQDSISEVDDELGW